MKTQFPEVFKLGVKEKLRLIEDLWDSIPQTPGAIPVSDELIEELDRRKAAHERNPEAAVSWEEAKKIIRGGGK